ncbi:MAG: hypothetical protein JWM16_4396 [Verrucomicrobiales bacterium]|nr:hypothetical protein [Verrucomicrobiales bacterium]
MTHHSHFLKLALTCVTAGFVVLHGAQAAEPADPNASSGLVVTFASSETKMTDSRVVPNVWLFVESGKSPSPFLPAGKFTAVYEGILNAELRGDFTFQADLNGTLKLELNGATALEATSDSGATSPMGKTVSLNKGANKLKATFTSPMKGDAFVRLSWAEKGKYVNPIPLNFLAHEPSASLEQAQQLHLGRELFLEHRCAKCHTPKLADNGIPDLQMDAPTFEGIGARRNFEWMSRWIQDPKSIRPIARMPKVLHGENIKGDATAIAAYLASLKTGGEVSLIEPKPWTKLSTPEKKEDGDQAPAEAHGDAKPTFERLHCVGCHNTPDGKDEDPKKIPLKQVAEKFPAGKLAEFLRGPEVHYGWIRMPNFRLSSPETKELSEYLLKDAAQPKDVAAPTEAAILDKGKSLVQSAGCLQCHSLKLDNRFTSPDFAKLAATAKTDAKKDGSCLAGTKPFADYGFTDKEKAALTSFVIRGTDPLTRHVPAEFAQRQTKDVNCTACHGQVDGFPPLEILGGKLRPEWVAKFIGGEISYKPRAEKHPKGEPWLEMRMPTFKSRAKYLAEGLAQTHGYPSQTPTEPAIDPELVKIGQKIVGKDGGLSCISCHGVNTLEATEVFESEGVNLAYSADRLLPQYYRRWLRSPVTIDPQTKMPVYFDEGKSLLTDILDGDAEKQISAIWHYIRMGSKMPLPSTGAQ